MIQLSDLHLLALILSGLKDMFHVGAQCKNVFKSSCKLIQSSNECMVEYNMVSSAYNLTLHVFDVHLK